MVKLTVLYGHPEDPASLEAYYAGTHMPLAELIPNVARVETAKAVASLGVMVVMTGVMVVRQGTAPPPVQRIFAEGSFELAGVTLAKDRAWFAVLHGEIICTP